MHQDETLHETFRVNFQGAVQIGFLQHTEALQDWFRGGNVDGGIMSRLGKDGGLARRNEEGGEVLIDEGKILLQILDEYVQLIGVSLDVVRRFVGWGIDATVIAAAASG